jgi:hypothetical protein
MDVLLSIVSRIGQVCCNDVSAFAPKGRNHGPANSGSSPGYKRSFAR